MKRGNCFYDAAMRIISEPDQGWVLVHGLPIGTGPENKGQRYEHGWLERPGLGRYAICWDPNADVELLDYQYYHHGKIDPDYTIRYQRGAVLELVQDSGHSGPWGDRLKSLLARYDGT